MVNGLSRDYWPTGTTYVFGRTALAFLLSPPVMVAVVLLLLVIAEMVFVGGVDPAHSRALDFGVVVLVGTYVIMLTAGLVAFLILWSLRLRGRLAYLLAGMAVGLICALAAPLFGTAPVGPVPVVIFTVYFGLLMLVVRAVAGIRATEGTPRIDA